MTASTPPEIFMPTEIVMRSVADLLPYAANSRNHSPAQIDALCAVIRKAGWTNPLLIADGGILAGHGRVMAAKKLGLARVPCIDLSHLTELERKALVISDNRLAELATWDLEVLKAETDLLRDAGLDVEELTAFSEADLTDLFADILGPNSGNTDPEAVPPLPDEPVSRLGDIWVMGAHRIGCMDSLSIPAWDLLMGGIQADLCVTDPPYNVAYEGGTKDKLTIINDSMSDVAFRQFLVDAHEAMYAVMKPGAPVYVAHSDTEGLNFRAALKEAGFKLSGCLIWQKNSLVMGRSDYQWKHEPILYGWKPGAAHKWYGGRKLTTVVEYGDSAPFTKLPDGRWSINAGGATLILSGDVKVEEAAPGSIIYHDKPTRSDLHPTTKPVGLWEKLIAPSSRPGDVVIDSFSGSGTTVLACERMGRVARVAELDPRFVDVAVRRWEQYTGLRAVHAITGELFPADGESRAAGNDNIAVNSEDDGEPF